MAVSNKLTNRNSNNKPQTFSSYLTCDLVRKKINEMVGGRDGQRFITSIISAVSVNPALSECEYGTILSAAMLGESLKLSPSPQLGQYYMVPFNDKKRGCKVAQFQLGYKGYIQLAIRSGYYKKINVISIKEGELIRFDPLEEEIEVNLIEDEMEREAAPTIGYYAMFEYHNGFKKAMYWSKAKMIAHADKFSQAFSKDAVKARDPKYNKVSFADFEAGKVAEKDMWLYSSFWYKDFDGMAYKTMLRQLISKWGIMSIELQTAIDKDMAAIHEDGTVDYVDNLSFESHESEETPSDAVQGEVIQVDPATGEVIEDKPDAAASVQDRFFED
ncbi:MAG: recombinase RecT [Butyricicoccus pullicaecorum]|nr:recombinase RecT [Butyricicoccus pullicaecorum]